MSDVIVVHRLAQAFGLDVNYLVGTYEADGERTPTALAKVGITPRR
jgi:hypothetical protein